MRPKPKPSILTGFIAYIHATFIKKIFYISQGKWKSHIKHHRKWDNLTTGFEVAKGYEMSHGYRANRPVNCGQDFILTLPIYGSTKIT